MNKEICHSDDGLWKMNAKYIVKEKKYYYCLFSLQKTMFKFLVILFVIKLYARVNMFKHFECQS